MGADVWCGPQDDDSIKCWGRNHAGQLGHGDTVSTSYGTANMEASTPPAAGVTFLGETEMPGRYRLTPGTKSLGEGCVDSTQGPSNPQSKVIFRRFRQLLTIDPTKWLQDRTWDAPTKGLLWWQGNLPVPLDAPVGPIDATPAVDT